LFVPDLPVYSAKFAQGGSEIILTGNRKHFYSYNMGSNKLERLTIGTLDQKNLSNITLSKSEFMCVSSSESGHAHILSQKTKVPLFSLKMNGSC